MNNLVRTALVDLHIDDLITEKAIVDSMLSYYRRQDDHSQIKAAVVGKYGLGIRRIEDPRDSTKTVETYVKEGFSERVDAGIITAISLGFGSKIVSALSTLFTEPGSKFALVHEDENFNLENAELYLKSQRDSGGYNANMVEADRMSVQTGSSALMIQFFGGQLSYQQFSYSDVSVFFAPTIDHEGTIKSTDPTDLEDASIVLLRLNKVDLETWNYLAIMARSDLYPDGRYVTFSGGSDVSEVPAIGDKGTNDFDIEGVLCNPLSYYANRNKDLNIPEYPISIFKGGHTSSQTVMPWSSSLYSDCLDFDVDASHLISTSQDAARGTLAIKRDAKGAGAPALRTLHGAIDVPYGMDVEHISHDAQASKIGLEVLHGIMVDVASAYGVPDYMVISEDHTLDASSGVALAIKARPLKKNRERRIEENRPAVNKVFAIERALIDLFGKEDRGIIEQLKQCTQTWEPGELELPQNKKEESERIIAELDKGLRDTIDAIRELNNLPSDTDAIEFYEKMKDRAAEYPPLAQEQQQQRGKVGLLRNVNQNGIGNQNRGLQSR